MKCKRLNEVIELLQPAWQKEPDLNLLQFLQKLAKESGRQQEHIFRQCPARRQYAGPSSRRGKHGRDFP